ncbi:MAG: hypothetical protein PVI21_02350 [Candidatus Woesebacteria bacterium]|jgi:hypothetical protein
MDTKVKQLNSRGSKKTVVIAAVAAVALVILLIIGMTLGRTMFTSEAAIQQGKFQAVFLTNGQVYFGKLSNVEDNYVKLTQIYYLQVQQDVQPSTDDKESSSSSNAQVSLTKLGSELHGPEDAMYIAKDQVLFWENLNDNSKVTEAIQEYQNK